MLKRLSLWHKAITIASLAFGIGLYLATVNSILESLSYFTMQSNIMCLVVFICFIVLEINNSKKGKLYFIIKGGCTMSICIAGIVYNVGNIIYNYNFGDNPVTVLRTVFVHIVSPSLVILDYFLYEKKGYLKKIYILYWLPFLFYYIIYANIYACFGHSFSSWSASGNFAYFFLDYKKYGYFKVISWLSIILLVYIIICIVVLFYDSKRGKKESD